MIRAVGLIFTFIIAFGIEVRVEANEKVQLLSIDLKKVRENPLTSSLIEEPKACLSGVVDAPAAMINEPCALRIGSRRKLESAPSPNRRWLFSELTTVVLMGPDRFRLLKGTVKVSGPDTTTIETEHGEVQVADEAFVERSGGVLTIVNTGTAPIEFKGRGWTEARIVPSGLESSIDLPDIKSGASAASLPLPLDYDSQVVREAKLFDGSKDEFVKRLGNLVAVRSEAAGLAADLHRLAIDRQVASMNEREKARRQALEAREIRDRELRALFRKKTLNPQ